LLDHARYRLLSLLRQEALLRGDFILSSGQHSTYYLDARRVTLSSRGSPLVGAVFLRALQDSGVEAVAGLSVGADPIVCAIAVTAGQRNLAIDGLIVRKEPKGHGTGRVLEGPWREGKRVAIVDDTLTTGASALQAARAVEDAGGEICGIWALIDRNQGARGAIEGAGYAFAAIFSSDEILEDVAG
jgi:orotate phosphoribosyltransferase